MTSQSNTSEIILYKTSDGHAIVMIRCRGDRPVAPTTPGPRPKSIGSLYGRFQIGGNQTNQ